MHIYVVICLGIKKQTKQKKIEINKKLITIKQTKNKNINFESNINVKAIHLESIKKSFASKLLVSIKRFIVTSSMLPLFILSRFPLPNKRISVSCALFQSKLLGAIHLILFKSFILSFK